MTAELHDVRDALAADYDVTRLLGRGGMATVFLAEDRKRGGNVAIKVLDPDLAGSVGHERFLREIRIASALTHPGILTVQDSGEAAGLLYYVMPYVEGESLRERLARERQLPIDEAVSIASEVAIALESAHAQGFVHRDIKPDNIMLAGGRALLADFGIARAVDQAGTEKLTETGLAVGTPSYMSPEQWTGDLVDGRSDLYSLGCVTFEMLVGEPPFTGPTAQVILARHSASRRPCAAPCPRCRQTGSAARGSSPTRWRHRRRPATMGRGLDSARSRSPARLLPPPRPPPDSAVAAPCASGRSLRSCWSLRSRSLPGAVEHLTAQRFALASSSCPSGTWVRRATSTSPTGSARRLPLGSPALPASA
jgi:serine/threonine protein kinase